MSERIRVLVVDDSAFARKVLRLALSADARVEVVGTATDGLDALEKIDALRPDVITLDLVMPYLDGVGLLREMALLHHRPRVVLVTISDSDSELTIEALQLGAVDLVKKPTALASDRLYELAGELVEKVVAAAASRPPPSAPGAFATHALHGSRATSVRAVVIGTSTGGPQALTLLLSRLPSDFPAPIAIALHIPVEYTEALAKRLNQGSALDVVEAHDGLRLRAGQVVIARGGAHLTLHHDAAGAFARVSSLPLSSLYYPSVDLLFESAAQTFGEGVLGVVLTGMGDDGLVGARAIVAAGGRVLTEAEASAVVYGMPRVVKEAGLSSAEAPMSEMANAILRSL